VHRRESNVPAVNASPSVLAVAYRSPIAQAPDAMRQSNPNECRKTRLASPSPYPPLGSITFGFHRCVTGRVPDDFARLKREAQCSFGYAVKSREFLWNDLENPGVINCAAPSSAQNCTQSGALESTNEKKRLGFVVRQ